MSSVIRSLMVKVGADLSEFDKSLKTMSKNLKNAGKEISAAGKTLTKGLTVPILGATAAIGALTINAGKQADELITLSNKTGIATEALQEMEYAARFVDVEVETMTDSMFKMTQRMADARDGSKAQAEAFKALNIEVVNQDGTLRNAKNVWYEAIDALGKIASEADRDALAYELFGRSAQELNPLIKAGSVELNRLSQEAHEVGAVINKDTVTQLGKFDDEMQKLQAVIKSAGSELAAAFLPIVEKITPIIKDKIIPAIGQFVEKIGNIIDKFLALSPEMQGFIVALLGFAVVIGPILSVIGTLVTAIGGIVGAFGAVSAVIAGGGGVIAALGALLGPVGIVLVVIAALAAAAYLIIKNWEPISNFFKNLWASVSGWFVTAWENIRKFFIDRFIELPKKMLEIGRNIVSGLWGGIQEKISWLKNKVTDFASSITSGIKRVLGIQSPSKTMAAQVGKWIPAGIAAGILNNKDLIDKAMSNIGSNIAMNISPTMHLSGATSSGTVINITGNRISRDEDVRWLTSRIVRDLRLAGVRTNGT